MHCNTTLTGQNYKGYASKLSASFPRNTSLRIAVKCISCDLETFPNEMLNSEFEWKELDFSNSHLKYLKMNALNSTVSRRLKRLYFNNNSITYLNEESMPISFYMQELDLSHNLIENVTGNRIFSKYLHTLNLAYNRLTYLDPNLFKNIKVRTLILNNNRFLDASFTCHLDWRIKLTLSSNPIVQLRTFDRVQKMHPSNWSKCSIGSQVEELILVEANLKTINLTSATFLRLLNLSTNHLKFVEFENVELKVLDLHNNKIQAVKLRKSFSLKSVNLGRNNITNTLNISLPATLTDLDLSHNKITNFERDFLKKLYALKNINLAHCGLHVLNAETILQPSLKYLDLSYNTFMDLDMNLFNGLNKLDQLNLNGNRLRDLNVEDLKYPTHLGLSNNDWNCTRLKRIVDHLNRGNGFIFFKPCDPVKCKESVHGIACRSVENAGNGTALEASSESNEADDRFSDKELLIWKKAEANFNLRHPENTDDQNLASVALEISHDLQNIVKDIRGQRILEIQENYTENTANHTIKNRFRKIIDRIERLRGLTDGFVTEIIKSTATSGSFNGDMTKRIKHPETPDAYEPNTAAIVLIGIGTLVFVAAAAYFGVVIIRKRRFLSFNHVANYSQGH